MPVRISLCFIHLLPSLSLFLNITFQYTDSSFFHSVILFKQNFVFWRTNPEAFKSLTLSTISTCKTPRDLLTNWVVDMKDSLQMSLWGLGWTVSLVAELASLHKGLLPTENIWHIKKRKIWQWRVELESSVRQKWDNIPLTKLQQLIFLRFSWTVI